MHAHINKRDENIERQWLREGYVLNGKEDAFRNVGAEVWTNRVDNPDLRN